MSKEPVPAKPEKAPPVQEEKPRLEVCLARSRLVHEHKPAQEFKEGKPSAAARERLQKIREELDRGFLSDLITECRKPAAGAVDPIDEDHVRLLDRLVGQVTSEFGRGLVILTVLQLCIKAVAPAQSIRLHKSGGGGGNFSWAEGVPMRTLDNNYITPVLRRFDLIRMNKDGGMMTRTLAENYPYCKLYKAAIRGGRKEWMELVDLIEYGDLPARPALKHLIGLLWNHSDKFQASVKQALKAVQEVFPRVGSLDDAIAFVAEYVDRSDYSARVLEIAMHALFQVLEDAKLLEGVLKPLCQMRSANKKHGNVGDIEVIRKKGGLEILEAWDAKYGKPYLREELEEVNEKLEDHSETETVGFVVNVAPDMRDEIKRRMAEVEQLHDVEVVIQSFPDWVRSQHASRADSVSGKEFGRRWIMAFAESLTQQRRDRAPIDEPADAWVAFLTDYCLAWKL
jgi:hypothetical protein